MLLLAFGASRAYGSDRDLEYLGGPVQHTPHVYAIFWGSSWNKAPDLEAREETEEFFETISGSAWQGILTQYFDDEGPISSNVGFTPYIDESVTSPTNVTNQAIENTVARAIKENAWPHTLEDQFMVLMPLGTTYTKEYENENSAGWHSVVHSNELSGEGLTDVRYSAVENEPGGLLSTAAHEYAETVTDSGGGWYACKGGSCPEEEQIADRCGGHDGPIPPSGLQVAALWDNHLHECALADPEPPVLYTLTEEASSANPTEATLYGVVNPAGRESSYHFEYGTTAGYGNTTPSKVIGSQPDWSNVEVGEPIEGLKPGITYHYRIVGENSTGTDTGEDEQFTTPETSLPAELAPTVTTKGASEVGASAATLNATVNPNGAATTYYFEFGATESYGTKIPIPAKGAGSALKPLRVSQKVTDLDEGTTYHYRVDAQNEVGTTKGADRTAITDSLDQTDQFVLDPPRGIFPAPFTIADKGAVTLSMNGSSVSCSAEGEEAALTGSGEFDSSTTGRMDLTLHHCKESQFSASCTSPGQEAGTVVMEGLPFRLVYLSDGKPGVLFMPNEESEQFSTASCVGGLVKVEVRGSGMLGRITQPALGEASLTLTVELNATEGEQEYVKTRDGVKYTLESSRNGGKLTPAGLASEPMLTFGEGEAELRVPVNPVGRPALEPPGATFPASFSPAGEQTVRLRGGSYPINCATEAGVKALGGEGQFESASTGTATLTLHNCKESSFNSKCTTSGQATGTVKTESLPFRLVYLADGEPGVLFLPNAKSGAIATASCLSGAVSLKVSGSGVLGRITKPAPGEASSTLTVNLNAPEAGKGEYAQEYVKTEAGLEYGLQVSVNGGASKAAALEAEPVATFSGGKAGLAQGRPALEPPGGTFPASFSPAGEQTVRLRGGSYPINCTTESGVKALGGEGQFESASTGTATLTLHHCKESSFNSNCTTSGQATGTIKTEPLPFRLVYLSDGEPGVLFLPNAQSGTLAAAGCLGGLVSLKVSGSGVLGRITAPQLGEASSTLTVDLNAPEAGKGEYAQEYVKTEAGLEYGLQVSVNGGASKAAALEAEPVASFSGGKAGLAAAQPTLEPPGGTFPASFSPAGEQTVRLRGGSYPINCTTESGVKALGGEGQFESASTGTATLTLHHCKESSFNSSCTTSGQATGTIKTEPLPFRLVYLSDGEPGVLFLPNAQSGTLAAAGCLGGLVSLKVSGSGVLGRITAPQLGEASSTLTVNLNAPEAGKGEYAQEYVKTEAGLEYGLQVSVNGGASKAAALEAEPVASFSGGKGELIEG